ncbi:MAG: hypothetical protein AAF790_10775 [Planctomycetota bacterium]
MRSRFPLLLKKRGGRRTGARAWGHSGELLYHAVFVLVGVVACWWQATNVLLPDWRTAEETAAFREAICRVEASRVVSRGNSHQAVCSVRVLPTDALPSGAGRGEAPGQGEQAAADLGPDAAADNQSGAAATPLPPRPTATQARSEAKPAGAPAGGLNGELVDCAVAAPMVVRAQAQRLAERYRPGDQLTCWVDPADPSRVVLNRNAGWWPWLVLSIPISLVALGVYGFCRMLIKAGVSQERRQLVAQHAGRLRPTSADAAAVALATALPPTTDVDDSPGVKHRYRLPAVGATHWRLAGMAVLCLAWNAVVGFFLVGVISDHLTQARPNWALTIVVTPLALAGGWLAYGLLRDAWTTTGVGVTQVEIANHPLILGQTSGGVVFQTGQFRGRFLTIALVCDEVATFCEGTDTRTSTAEVYRQKLHTERRFRIESQRPFEQPFTFTVPADAMHSFRSPHNEVRWTIEVRAAPMRWPEYSRRFRLCVYPANLPPPADRYADRTEDPADTPAATRLAEASAGAAGAGA